VLVRLTGKRLLPVDQMWKWDFFYADLYRNLLTPQAIDDMASLCSSNRVGTYHWWSIEQAVLEVVHAGLAERLPVWMLNTLVSMTFSDAMAVRQPGHATRQADNSRRD
jgi:hypothetical protein